MKEPISGSRVSNRRVHSNDLRGTRGGIEYVSASDADMRALELTIAKELNFRRCILTPFIGVNHWDLSAEEMHVALINQKDCSWR